MIKKLGEIPYAMDFFFTLAELTNNTPFVTFGAKNCF